jgi:predicted chitinase
LVLEFAKPECLVDARDFIIITKRINGGINGLDECKWFYKTALTVLASRPSGYASFLI